MGALFSVAIFVVGVAGSLENGIAGLADPLEHHSMRDALVIGINENPLEGHHWDYVHFEGGKDQPVSIAHRRVDDLERSALQEHNAGDVFATRQNWAPVSPVKLQSAFANVRVSGSLIHQDESDRPGVVFPIDIPDHQQGPMARIELGLGQIQGHLGKPSLRVGGAHEAYGEPSNESRGNGRHDRRKHGGVVSDKFPENGSGSQDTPLVGLGVIIAMFCVGGYLLWRADRWSKAARFY